MTRFKVTAGWGQVTYVEADRMEVTGDRQLLFHEDAEDGAPELVAAFSSWDSAITTAEDQA